MRLGTVSLDGAKIHANASRHNALSYGRAQKIEAQLRDEVRDLLARAEAADSASLPAGLSIPDELARREARLSDIAEAKAKIEARAAERFADEQRHYEERLAAREARAKARGKRPGGRRCRFDADRWRAPECFPLRCPPSGADARTLISENP